MSKQTRKTKSKQTPAAADAEAGIVHPNAAGLDVGAEEVYACLPAGRAEPRVRRFATYTPDLQNLAKWLKSSAVDTVALESTGV